MKHEIVEREVDYSRTIIDGGGFYVGRSPTRAVIRQCANCGCSKGMIEHMGWDECSAETQEDGDE